MRLLLAVRAFFGILANASVATQVQRVLESPYQDSPTSPASDRIAHSPSDQQTTSHSGPPNASDPSRAPSRESSRSDAITLLAALQREARFLDIVQEPLDDYEDAQVGAAARDVLRDCSQVLQRMFGIQSVVDQQEGDDIEIPAKFDQGRYRLTGNVSGEPPWQGQLIHHGWQATRCELPQWSGSKQSALVVAPVEVEVQ